MADEALSPQGRPASRSGDRSGHTPALAHHFGCRVSAHRRRLANAVGHKREFHGRSGAAPYRCYGNEPPAFGRL